MSHGKHFTLFTHPAGPNGWKIAFVFKELGLTYESIYLDFNTEEHRAPEFTKYNPNGRIPAIIDHKNNDFVLWESNAILQYVVDKYDKDHKLSTTGEERYRELQWLYYQASGQGPYFGQAFWFIMTHPEKVPSAIERYRDEIKRIFGVLESVLSKQEWLVGGKLTIADLSFVPWNDIAEKKMLESFDFDKEFPATARWQRKMLEIPSIKKAWAERTALLA